MSNERREIIPGSELDAAIERALEAANLRAGGATSANVSEPPEPSAAESAPVTPSFDGFSD